MDRGLYLECEKRFYDSLLWLTNCRSQLKKLPFFPLICSLWRVAVDYLLQCPVYGRWVYQNCVHKLCDLMI